MNIDTSISNPAKLPCRESVCLIYWLAQTAEAAAARFQAMGLPVDDGVTVYRVGCDWYYPLPEKE